uniref:Uncharacterized protein n=1 Tax=Bionectria ochroleuca TaxID=29856 RepID=A0A8H7N597_BIOOC
MPISFFILQLTDHPLLCWLQPRHASEIASLGTWHIPPLPLIFTTICLLLFLRFLSSSLSVPPLSSRPALAPALALALALYSSLSASHVVVTLMRDYFYWAAVYWASTERKRELKPSIANLSPK